MLGRLSARALSAKPNVVLEVLLYGLKPESCENVQDAPLRQPPGLPKKWQGLDILIVGV
jgi:hypothetical protein